MPDATNLELSRPESLVLFELVSRFTERGVLSIEHPSEEQVLWNVCSLLEKALVEPLSPRYRDFLASAREAVRPAASS
jgi:hypothetical protein